LPLYIGGESHYTHGRGEREEWREKEGRGERKKKRRERKEGVKRD